MTAAAHEHHTTIATAVALVHFPAIALASRLAVPRDGVVVELGPAVVAGLQQALACRTRARARDRLRLSDLCHVGAPGMSPKHHCGCRSCGTCTHWGSELFPQDVLEPLHTCIHTYADTLIRTFAH